jgi:hypothetical protein
MNSRDTCAAVSRFSRWRSFPSVEFGTNSGNQHSCIVNPFLNEIRWRAHTGLTGTEFQRKEFLLIIFEQYFKMPCGAALELGKKFFRNHRSEDQRF